MRARAFVCVLSGSADWPNPKLSTRPEDKVKKLASAPGAEDFGVLRTRAEVRCHLPIYDVNDPEKKIGTLSVEARVKHPLMYNPKDGSGADQRREAGGQALVFTAEPESLGASPAPVTRGSASLGAVPDKMAAEPAAPKRGGAALAAARGKQAATGSQQLQPAAGGETGTHRTQGTKPREPAPAQDDSLVAVAKKFQIPIAVLKQPDSIAAYGQSYHMLECHIGLIALEIQVRTNICVLELPFTCTIDGCGACGLSLCECFPGKHGSGSGGQRDAEDAIASKDEDVQ